MVHERGGGFSDLGRGRDVMPVVLSGRRGDDRLRLRRSVMADGSGWHALETQSQAGGQRRLRSGQCEHRRDDRYLPGQERHVFSIPPQCSYPYKAWRLSRRALPMTDTELNVIAALAMIGLSSSPNAG
jgi:hypothetical protein